MAKNRKDELVLRCFGYPGKNDGKEGYYAVCIDLSLVTWRPTITEAKKSLAEAVHGYLDTVIDLAKEGADVSHMVPRKAAFFPYGLMYYAIALLVALQKNDDTNSQTPAIFNNPVECPPITA